MGLQVDIPFNQLNTAELIVEAVYKGGVGPSADNEPLHHLFPKCGVSGGFRKVKRKDRSRKFAYVILYTTMSEPEWPDFLNQETGLFRYYGDNRTPGQAITDTKLKGNTLLEEVFAQLNGVGKRDDIPPFFIFKKAGSGRDVQFLGLAAPGNPAVSPDQELTAFWRTIDESRFLNYVAYFTVLDTGDEPISRDWLNSLIYDHEGSLAHAPDAWRRFIKEGRDGIIARKVPRIS